MYTGVLPDPGRGPQHQDSVYRQHSNHRYDIRIVSPYILAGDNTCIQVYYQTQGGVLNIRTVSTDSILTTGMI